MTLRSFLENITAIACQDDTIPVEQTAAALLQEQACPGATIELGAPASPTSNTLLIGVLDPVQARSHDARLEGLEQWSLFHITPEGTALLYASHPWFIYRLTSQLLDDWSAVDITAFAEGRISRPAFRHLRPAYDSLLNNHARTARGFDPEEHIRDMARLGYTHVEVNGLAATFPDELAAPDELLYRFYNYTPALDQFVYTKLNKGIYPFEYLKANLNKLKKSAALAEKYGLRAGILSFEPRSVSDQLLERYPMLRGARVDHPLRSFRPRYNLTTAHPVVLEHYAQMMEKLLVEAPNIDYMVIWSNDSGAGFEYTSSLYVGRNGGGYVIREFRGDDAIKQAAADNIIRYMKTLREAGRKVNPDFKVILRSEMFYDERDLIWEQMEEGLDIESHTFVAKGFDLGYRHPKYDWAGDFLLTSLYNQFADEEKESIQFLESKGAEAHTFFNSGSFWNQEPVIAPVYPKLVFDKLTALSRQNVKNAAIMTGTVPPSMAPYNINQEVVRAFQNNPDASLDTVLQRCAQSWVGPEYAETLIQAWIHADEAYRSFPPPVSIHSVWSTWYRTLVRPFVPNYDALSEEDRAYYEDFHLGHANNLVRVDFRREINFEFCTPEYAGKCRAAITENVFPEIGQALRLVEDARDASPPGSPERDVFAHLHDRLYGIKCWFRNQRNIAAWIEGVHTYLEAKDDITREKSRAQVRELVLDEKANAKDLLDHFRTAETEWMLMSAVGETTFIYGENFGELLEKKIALMEGREDDEPYIDPDYMWRVPGMNC